MNTKKKKIIGISIVGVGVLILIAASLAMSTKNSIDQFEAQSSSTIVTRSSMSSINDENIKPTDLMKQNNTVQITFNSGKSWLEVPVEADSLESFNGITTDDKGLDSTSYFLKNNQASFVYVNAEKAEVEVTQTLNKGDSWQKTTITHEIPAIRYRKIDYVTEKMGYIIYTAGKTMGQEGVMVYVTQDKGKSWQEVASPFLSTLVTDSIFLTEKLGFIVFNSIQVEEKLSPNMQATNDGGNSWQTIIVTQPEKYESIFVQAEAPFMDGNELIMLVNQGENGDYEGGVVKGKYKSTDNGLNWQFVEEV